MGYRFKRGVMDGDLQLGWLQGTARSYEYDLSAVVLSAVPVSDKVYTVNENIVAIFGSKFMQDFDKVIASSTLFRFHREHGLIPTIGASTKMLGLNRGNLTTKSPETLLNLLTGTFAQLYVGIAQTFESAFISVRKASPAHVLETQTKFAKTCTEEAANARKHVLWLLREMEPTKLRSLMTTVVEQLPKLQQSAFAEMQMPQRVATQLQDEMPGAALRTGAGAGADAGGGSGGGRTRKNAGKNGDVTISPTKDLPPPKLTGGGKKAKSLEELMGSGAGDGAGAGIGAGTPGTAQFAAILQAQLAKCTSEEEMNALKSKLAAETLRADREKLRADAEQTTADHLRGELSDLRKALDAEAAKGKPAAGSSDPAEKSALVLQLESENGNLRKLNASLILLLGQETSAAAAMLQTTK